MVKIMPIEFNDCEEIISWNKGKEQDYLYQWAGHKIYTYPITVEQIANRLSEKDILIFKILYEDKMIGSIELAKIDKSNNKARICRFIIKDDYKGKGIGQKALIQVLDFACKELSMYSFDLGVFVNNMGAIRCYEKVGFLVESHYESPEGSKWNSYTMSKKYVKSDIRSPHPCGSCSAGRGTSQNNGFTQELEGKSMKQGSEVRA